jgi:DNA-binding response OmpR family regulator
MAPTRCMIVEDQALIGMSLEASLEEAGFAVEGPFMSSAQALHWLESDTPDIALLDVMLKDGTSVEIARALKSRGIPFAIYSGLPPNARGPSELQNVPWLEKPVSRETLTAVLGDLVAQPQNPPVPESPKRPESSAGSL